MLTASSNVLTFQRVTCFLVECNQAMGVANSSAIPDSAITSSSQLDLTTPAQLGRITADPVKEPLSWCASSAIDQWLQLDLGHLHVVSGVATQGSGYGTGAWVGEYQLSYSKDNKNFTIYKENSLVRVSENKYQCRDMERAGSHRDPETKSETLIHP